MLVGKNDLSKSDHPELQLQESSSRACNSLTEADVKCSTKRHLLQSSDTSSGQSSLFAQKKVACFVFLSTRPQPLHRQGVMAPQQGCRPSATALPILSSSCTDTRCPSDHCRLHKTCRRHTWPDSAATVTCCSARSHSTQL